jgi:superfamily II DNA/RNA helicase
MALLIGGVSMGDQMAALEKGVDVLIATPGRLMDLFGRGKILLTGCSLLVIDEADRMLDMGFIPDIEEICTKLPATRQTLLFSATMPPPIKKLADRFLTNPKTIEVSRPASSNALIDQRLMRVDARKKKDVLRDRLRGNDVRTAIVFCNRKTTVRELATSLKRSGLRAGEIHGDMEQADRIKELDRFKAEEINILVASDVAARGLDIKGVSHVFNYDVPWHPDDYIHRIGRTGRAGKTGVAITLVTSADAEAIEAIEKLSGTAIRVVEGLGDGAPAPAAPDEAGEAAPPEHPARRESKAGESKAREPRERSRGGRGRSRTEARPERAAGTRAESAGPESEALPEPELDARPEREAEPRHRPRREPEARTKPRSEPKRQRREEPADEGDEGWNGPVPSFLGKPFGG